MSDHNEPSLVSSFLDGLKTQSITFAQFENVRRCLSSNKLELLRRGFFSTFENFLVQSQSKSAYLIPSLFLLSDLLQNHDVLYSALRALGQKNLWNMVDIVLQFLVSSDSTDHEKYIRQCNLASMKLITTIINFRLVQTTDISFPENFRGYLQALYFNFGKYHEGIKDIDELHVVVLFAFSTFCVEFSSLLPPYCAKEIHDFRKSEGIPHVHFEWMMESPPLFLSSSSLASHMLMTEPVEDPPFLSYCMFLGLLLDILSKNDFTPEEEGKEQKNHVRVTYSRFPLREHEVQESFDKHNWPDWSRYPEIHKMFRREGEFLRKKMHPFVSYYSHQLLLLIVPMSEKITGFEDNDEVCTLLQSAILCTLRMYYTKAEESKDAKKLDVEKVITNMFWCRCEMYGLLSYIQRKNFSNRLRRTLDRYIANITLCFNEHKTCTQCPRSLNLVSVQLAREKQVLYHIGTYTQYLSSYNVCSHPECTTHPLDAVLLQTSQHPRWLEFWERFVGGDANHSESAFPFQFLQRCSGCMMARYCSMECRRVHWSDHKPICEAFSSLYKRASIQKRERM